jgi:hypothetical protein
MRPGTPGIDCPFGFFCLLTVGAGRLEFTPGNRLRAFLDF